MTNRELAEIIYNLTIEIRKSIQALKEWQEEVKGWTDDRTRGANSFNSHF